MKSEDYRVEQLKRLSKFFARATYNGSCMEYCPDKFSNYIQLRPAPKQYFKNDGTFLHRFVYAVWNDTPLAKTDVIMHTCHNRICINPRHLKLGTHKENNWRNQ